MGYLFDEKAYVESNIALHESRLTSQYARFLDSSPTFTTYYRINNIETTTDRGFLNVERVLGGSSPVRFNEVTRLPMYGIDQIVLDLDLGDEGINADYQGSATILPNTVIPRPGDFFIIDHIGSSLVLNVTSIAYDTFRSNNYYKIEYKVKAIDDGSTLDVIRKQTVDRFVCYYENIGTEDKVLMRSADVDIANSLNEITTQIANYYKMLYYDNRYNSFLFNSTNGFRYYDRVLTRFIVNNKIFSQRKGYDTIFLADEDRARTIDLEYHNSIYRALEQRKASLLKDVKCFDSFVFDIESVFTRWRDKSIVSVVQGQGVKDYIRPDLIQFFRDSVELFDPRNQEEYEEPQPTDGQTQNFISIPDTDLKPVYVKDQNIMEKEPVAISEEEAIKIVRQVHPYDNLKTSKDKGVLDLDSIFGNVSEEEETDEREEMPFINIGDRSAFEPAEEHTNFNPITQVPIVKEDLSPFVEGTPGMPKKEVTIEFIRETPQYLLTPDEYRQENIMTVILAKYFSGHTINISEINIEELRDYMSYMDLNSMETFLLTPMFLYVLEQYFISHLGK